MITIGENLINKKNMKKSISALVVAVLVLINTNSFSYSSDPKTFIAELVDDAIKTLSDKVFQKRIKLKN